jgi:hypothetical protein
MLSIAQQTNRLADAFADKHVPGAHAHALEKISIIDDAFCCLLFVVLFSSSSSSLSSRSFPSSVVARRSSAHRNR